MEVIGKSVFANSGSKLIMIPSSVVVLGEQSFYERKSLESTRFENGSRMESAGGGTWKASCGAANGDMADATEPN
jgi:hypothetical protein